MTDSRQGARRPADRDAGPAGSARVDARSAVLDICPYLRADTGSWRTTQPSRDHRCHAVTPPAVLATTKQRSLCLQPAYTSCATYRAAQAAAAAIHPRAEVEGGGLWPPSRSTLLVLEPSGGAARTAPLGAPRIRPGSARISPLQAAVVGVLVVAILAVVGLRSLLGFGDGGASPQPSNGVVQPSASVVASQVPSTLPTVEPTAVPASESPLPTAVPSQTTTPTATPKPTATPRPTATPKPSGQTYTVKSGDSLSSIAAKFPGVTWQSIAAANNIKAPYSIHTGQVLKIPAP